MSAVQVDTINESAHPRTWIGYGDGQICIELDEERLPEGSTPVYTNGSTITGLITINPAYCLPFDYFSIAFVGEADTQLNDSNRAPEDPHRVFLRMQMPINPEGLPREMKFKAGEKYHHPVVFKVPAYLPMGACKHECQSDHVRENHLRLPPSIGSWGHRTDQSPTAVAINYTIRVQAYQLRRGKLKLVMQTRKLVYILSSFSPDTITPSLNPTPDTALLHTHQLGWRASFARIAVLRNSWPLASTGKLETTVLRPCPLLFSAATGEQITKPTPCIRFVFTPGTSDVSPPRLRSVAIRVVATTFYASAPMSNIPSTQQWYEVGTSPANQVVSSYTKNSKVEPFTHQTLDWKAETERDLFVLTHDTRKANTNNSLVVIEKRYTAFLRLPITTVNTKTIRYLPTFHSCMVARSYTLQIQLSMGTIGSSIKLEVPLVVGIHPTALPTYNEKPSVSNRAISVQDLTTIDNEVSYLPEYAEFLLLSSPTILLTTIDN